MTLNEVMTQTADAIREKTGKSEKIAPVNFAEEIKGITAGGGESASTIEYLDLREVENIAKTLLFNFSTYVKLTAANGVSIMWVGMALMEGVTYENVDFIAIDFSALAWTSEELEGGSKKDFLTVLGVDTDSIPRITKEQFYTLE